MIFLSESRSLGFPLDSGRAGLGQAGIFSWRRFGRTGIRSHSVFGERAVPAWAIAVSWFGLWSFFSAVDLVRSEEKSGDEAKMPGQRAPGTHIRTQCADDDDHCGMEKKEDRTPRNESTHEQ